MSEKKLQVPDDEDSFKLIKNRTHLFLRDAPYQLIIVLDTHEISQTNKRALLTLMDGPTWRMTLISMFAIASSLYYFKLIKENFVGVLITIFGTILNQGINLPKIRFTLFLTIGVWNLVLIVITNGYAGLLLSHLTKPTIPYVPDDLEGLLDSSLQFDMATFESVSARDLTSSFSYTVSRYKEFLGKIGRDCPICDRILNMIHYVIPERGYYDNTVIEYLTRMNHEQMKVDSFENVSFKNFVLIGESESVGTLEEVVRLVFKKRKIVVKIRPTQHLSQQYALAAGRSYASKMAEKHFSQVQSSGLVGQWVQAYDLSSINYIRQYYDIFSDLTIRENSFGKLFLGRVYERLEPEKLTLTHFLVPFIIFGFAVLLCTVCFIFEWTAHLWNLYIVLQIITFAGNQGTRPI